MRVLVQAGQMCLEAGVEDSLSGALGSAVENEIVMSVFRLRGWVEVGEEPGQRGWSLGGVVRCFWVVEGVSAGTQKEGRVALED